MPPTTIYNTARFIPVSVVREDPCAICTETPEQTLRYWREVIATQPDYEPDKEHLAVILVNARLRPYSWHLCSKGTIDETIAHARDVLRPVIVGGAKGFLLCHNHPSGDPAPSRADRDFTKRVHAAAELFQLRFLDHVITTDVGRSVPDLPPYFSFRESGII